MKNFIYTILIVSGFLIIQSCDKIDPPYKESTNIPPPVLNPQDQKILVEDYTGHTCGNCPKAARTAQGLKSIYGDRLVIMSVHAGYYAQLETNPDSSYSYDFRTPVGNDLDAPSAQGGFGISNAGNPNGMVNRKFYNGNRIAAYGSWGTHVQDIVDSNILANGSLVIENSYNSSSRELNTTVKSAIFNDLTKTYKLCVYLIEDSVKNWQKDYDPNFPPLNNPNYWHRDVLRASLNGTWGDLISPVGSGIAITNQYSITINSTYRESYCKIIAFIYDDATKEIVQVEEKAIQ
jgi:hypothetical protein